MRAMSYNVTCRFLHFFKQQLLQYKVSAIQILSIAILTCFVCRNSQANDPVYKETLQKRLNYIFKDEKLAKSKLGVSVYSLTANEPLYELNANDALSPASAIKILTAYVALKKLGNDFTFKTYLKTNGQIRDGVLKGNLYFIGGGDPAFVTERLYLMVEDLHRFDIKKNRRRYYC